MRNKTGVLLTDDTPRFKSEKRYRGRPDKPEDICIQLKARHFVTCPTNDTEYVCVEEDCYGCECFDHINSTEHTIHCNGIFDNCDTRWLYHQKEEIIRDWIESDGELGQ